MWHSVAPEVQVAKKVTADKEGAGPLPRIVVEERQRLSREGSAFLSADIEAHGHTGGCPG